ncbi:MAG: hypothetical protein AB7K71_00005, partial [Polyangiaceae bacterium]
ESGEALACGDTACSTNTDCLPTDCECNDGSTNPVLLCLTSNGCCATPEDTCRQHCSSRGGWVGDGSGGSSGGSGASGGNAGSSGSSGSAGSSGSSSRPSPGDECIQPQRVTCGCDGMNPLCNALLQCNLGTLEYVGECDPGVTCLTSQSLAGCGTTTFYTPYAGHGSACTVPSYACTTDGRALLHCDGLSWNQDNECPLGTSCQAIPASDPGCSSSTFCVGCR